MIFQVWCFQLVTVSARKYRPFQVLVSGLNQNSGFGRTLGQTDKILLLFKVWIFKEVITNFDERNPYTLAQTQL